MLLIKTFTPQTRAMERPFRGDGFEGRRTYLVMEHESVENQVSTRAFGQQTFQELGGANATRRMIARAFWSSRFRLTDLSATGADHDAALNPVMREADDYRAKIPQRRG